MFFSWDKVALGGNISRDFKLLRRGVLIRANERLAGPENGCVFGARPCRDRSAIRRVEGDPGLRNLTAYCRDCQASAWGPECQMRAHTCPRAAIDWTACARRGVKWPFSSPVKPLSQV